mmetsp:Transcript_24021/g.47713  ORF Transcript_24021/g.47713 Transcript_24021/m.47713 type:complete len:80 (-) Transcript_24021:553-792(-)
MYMPYTKCAICLETNSVDKIHTGFSTKMLNSKYCIFHSDPLVAPRSSFFCNPGTSLRIRFPGKILIIIAAYYNHVRKTT